MAQFFINRPIFAWVIAIIIMLAGLLAIKELPVAQYPAIAPPQISITAIYPGASASTLENTVTQVIEQKMNGIDDLIYISSNSDSSGMATVTLTFKSGTDSNIAQVQVQNKLQLALPMLPQVVQQQGVRVAKSTRNFLMIVGFYSEDGSMSRYDLSDYAAANIQDTISRLPGVGDVTLFGSQYAMRIWLDPMKLKSYNLTPTDVKNAIRAQNIQVASGQLGGTPAAEGQQLNATITAQTLLKTTEEFAAILLKTDTDGSTVSLGDVSRLELGSESYDIQGRFNGNQAAGIAIMLATDGNAIDTAERVKAKVKEMSQFFPKGMKAVYPYDTSPFVKISIGEVVKTLIEAIILVFLVMYLFLQNFRATLIPTIAVPVVLLGTFGVLSACGYSINTLTMFAMVLAIGLLVDDAIVVVENVERIMSEEGLSPKKATQKSMTQITGALVGIALVLSAVFVPMAFFGGATGVIYRQFSITIVSAMTLSVLVALILTPALCATMLKPLSEHTLADEGLFSFFFIRFNRAFNKSTLLYQSAVGKILPRAKRFMAIYLILLVGMGYLFMHMPTSFLPEEDQGILFALISLPVGATQERTLDVVKQVEHHFLDNETEAVDSLFTAAGFSFAGRGQNMGIAFIQLKDWDLRKRADLKAQAVAGKAMGALSQIKDARIFIFAPPAVMELGNATGFNFQLQDRNGLGHEALMNAQNMLLDMARKNQLINPWTVRSNGQDDTPQYKLDIDYHKAGALGVSFSDINDTLTTAWGGSYINDFIDKGRVKKVYVKGDAPFRMNPDDLDLWHVRNNKGEMVPFSTFATSHWIYESPRLERFNGMPSREIQGDPAMGVSTGVAMQAMEEMAAKLPPGIGFEWSGISYQEKMSGSQAPALYAISLLVVFLCLAALYESWAVPFSVMLVVPLGILGALVAAQLRHLSNDVYFQVGLLTTIGLSAKNAILIVEFAKEQMTRGVGLIEATLEAVRLRLRPILMTSLAFILGVTPLVTASGAGSGSQHAIGTGVMGGMISATFLAIFFVPLFFVIVRNIFKYKPQEDD